MARNSRNKKTNSSEPQNSHLAQNSQKAESHSVQSQESHLQNSHSVQLAQNKHSQTAQNLESHNSNKQKNQKQNSQNHNQNNKKSLLTILVPLYNKEKYLKDTLDSILMQETSYHYEILINDDASSDKSVEIVKEYQKSHPNITLLESKQNEGLATAILKMYALVKTKYFSVLDPDDYWLSKTKIQDALDFLESHNDFTSYQGKTLIKSNEGEKIYTEFPQDAICDFATFSAGGGAIMAHTSSGIFRASILKNHLSKMQKQTGRMRQNLRADSFRNFMALFEGKAYHSAKVDSVYRWLGSGLYTSKNEVAQTFDNALFWLDMWWYFKEFVFLYGALQFYGNVVSRGIVYLDSIKDDCKLRSKIAEFMELEKLYNEKQQEIRAFEAAREAQNRQINWVV